MQDAPIAQAALNGSGMAHGATALAEAGAPAPVLPAWDDAAAAPARGKRPSALDPIMADPESGEALRRDVMETTESLGRIAERWGVHPETLRQRIGALGWTRPEGAPKPPAAARSARRRLAATMADAGMVQARILRAIDRQIGKIDARLRKPGMKVEESDSRILGNLARTLGTLLEIGSGGTTSKEMERPNRAEVEARLAERIRRWARGDEGSA